MVVGAQATEVDTVVIGSGPMVTLRRFARLNLVKSCCYRKDNVGGVCLNIGCILQKP